MRTRRKNESLFGTCWTGHTLPRELPAFQGIDGVLFAVCSEVADVLEASHAWNMVVVLASDDREITENILVTYNTSHHGIFCKLSAVRSSRLPGDQAFDVKVEDRGELDTLVTPLYAYEGRSRMTEIHHAKANVDNRH